MSIQRQYERFLDDKAGIRRTRGAPRQFGRHIIKKGLRPNMKPKELHATKGWRNVPAWS